jgi:release factor glutamine methyltransferase
MQVRDVIREMAAIICTDDAEKDAREILAYILNVARSWPASHGAANVAQALADRARKAAQRRAAGAPIQYAAGLAAFRHLTLNVDERVLIPRPETELLVERALSLMNTGVAVDIGTGSGAIALSLAAEGEFDAVIATDVSADALDVARGNERKNAQQLRTPVEWRKGSFLASVMDVAASLIVSNPPYIAFAEAEALGPEVRDWEPPLALLSGNDGLAASAEIVRDAPDVLTPGGVLALEVDERRAGRVAQIAASDGRYRHISIEADLTGRDRFVFARRV